jgi:phosphate uptake regulator
MEYRKIIEFGKSSFVVSLPKAWMSDRGLKKGDVVYLEQDKSKLVIYPSRKPGKKEPKKITLDVSGMTNSEIRLRLVSRYIQNYNEITLTADNMKSKAKDIRTMVHDLMALEVIEEDASRIVTRDFINAGEISPKNLLKKMDIITRDMLLDSSKFFEEDKYSTIAERDSDVNRISFLVYRTLKHLQNDPAAAKKMGLRHEEFLVLWVASAKVEKIADQAKWITKLLRRVKFKKPEQEEFSKLYTIIQKYYTDAMDAYYDEDTEAAFALVCKSKRLMKLCRDFRRQNWNYEWVSELIEKLKSVVGETKSLMTYVCDLERQRS